MKLGDFTAKSTKSASFLYNLGDILAFLVLLLITKTLNVRKNILKTLTYKNLELVVKNTQQNGFEMAH